MEHTHRSLRCLNNLVTTLLEFLMTILFIDFFMVPCLLTFCLSMFALDDEGWKHHD